MDSEFWVAVIAAGSAVAGAIAGGWFARSAGLHQAAATRDTVQATLDEQRRTRVEERRRAVYLAYLKAADDLMGDTQDSAFRGAAASEALTHLAIEGPHELFMRASALQNSILASGRAGHGPRV
ncbi:hypothetical protein [Streptomyces sp. enrichment culture]|uniref:hypothetical protein n=1 Tax=Streptomyces sp. enrichment culture TaxID=1795815 RepID=UPI003F568FFF